MLTFLAIIVQCQLFLNVEGNTYFLFFFSIPFFLKKKKKYCQDLFFLATTNTELLNVFENKVTFKENFITFCF